MIVKSLHICWFRSIVDATLECTRLTALLGSNSCGKSSFLRALNLFYSARPQFAIDDFYAGDTSRSIEIEVTFTELTARETERFSDYIGPEGLKVVRVFSLQDGKAYDKCFGYRLQNSYFRSVKAATSAAEQKRLYQQLRQEENYAGLPVCNRKDEILATLIKWEREHPDSCILERDGGDFFCFDKSSSGDLLQDTRFIFIPAVRDAVADATEGKGSAITELMNLLIRNELVRRDEVKKLKIEFQQRYDQIFNRESLPEVRELEIQLSQTLQDFAPGSSVMLSLGTSNTVDIPLPKVEVQLNEDGYPSDITRKGHGTQRAFIVTLLQHQAVAQSQVPISEEVYDTKGNYTSDEDRRFASLILVIEEPELYQHPARQRHFANVLSRLADGTVNGVAHQTQVLYCTHSPLFVSIDWVDNLRLLRKIHAGTNKPMMTTVTYTTLDRVADILWRAKGSPQAPYPANSLRSRLQSLMTPWMNEGFFADVVVLVEGEDDRAAIQAIALLLDYDLESQGIAVIPCNGKSNLSKAAAIFQSLEIPIYVIWDGDSGKEQAVEENRSLLRLMGREPEDWPCEIAEEYACFDTNLEEMLKQEIGETVFESLLEECQKAFDISKRKQAIKNPVVISTLLRKAKDKGYNSVTLEQIFRKIIALKSRREMSKRIYQPLIADVQSYDDTEEEYAMQNQLVGIRVDQSF